MYSWFYSYTLLNVCFKIGTFARHACAVLALGRTEFFFFLMTKDKTPYGICQPVCASPLAIIPPVSHSSPAPRWRLLYSFLWITYNKPLCVVSEFKPRWLGVSTSTHISSKSGLERGIKLDQLLNRHILGVSPTEDFFVCVKRWSGLQPCAFACLTTINEKWPNEVVEHFFPLDARETVLFCLCGSASGTVRGTEPRVAHLSDAP